MVRSGNDGSLCAVNPLFLAIVVDYAFVVIPVSQTGRIDFQCNKVIGHTGQILDLKWNPFNDCVIASASDDCSVSAFFYLLFDFYIQTRTSLNILSRFEIQFHLKCMNEMQIKLYVL